jgi:hypothetical protein
MMGYISFIFYSAEILVEEWINDLQNIVSNFLSLGY